MSQAALGTGARQQAPLAPRHRRRAAAVQSKTADAARQVSRVAALEVSSRGAMDKRSHEPELRTLMLAGLDGDASAHKGLLTGLSAHLRAYFKGQLARIGRAPADAEDLVQETLIAIHTRRHTYDRSQLLTPWVYAIARYKLLDHLRRAKRSMEDVPIEEAEEVIAQDDPLAVQSAFDLQKLLPPISPKPSRAIQYV